MKRPVCRDLPQRSYSGRRAEDIWNEEFHGKALEDAEVGAVLRSEVWGILVQHCFVRGKVLDAGSGRGAWVKALQEEGFDVTGCDFCEEALDISRSACPDATFVRCDVKQLSFEDTSFDTILSWGVVEHLQEGPERALAEMFRCLRPSGRLAVSVPLLSRNRLVNPRVLLDRYIRQRPLVRRVMGNAKAGFYQYEFTRRDFEKRLGRAGFVVIAKFPIWLEFGLRSDFGRLYSAAQRCVALLSRFRILRRSLRWAFCAHMIFLCQKRKG